MKCGKYFVVPKGVVCNPLAVVLDGNGELLLPISKLVTKVKEQHNK